MWGIDLAHSANPKHIRADVRELRQVVNAVALSGCEVLYHLAAEFGRMNGEEYYEQLWSTNQLGTTNVINACISFDVKLILAGSSEAYGDTGLDNLTESWLDSNIATFHNQYALSKWVQERQVMIAAQNRKLKAVILRFFNAYGPGEEYNDYRSVVCLFAYRLLHDMPITVYKDYHRVFMYVDDWARTVANVAERFDSLPRGTTKSGIPIYNVGGEEYRSVEDLYELLICTIQPPAPKLTVVSAEAANVTNKRPDLTLAKRDLSHVSTVTLEKGMAKTVAWMREFYGK